MNRHLYRIIFNKKRGQLMVVAETAVSDGKTTGTTEGEPRGASPCLTALRPVSFALFVAMGLVTFTSFDATAQIVAYKTAPANQRPTILSAGNGVPLVNIQTPSTAGVSRNTYSQFDVQQQGAILNNAHTNAKTELGGWVQGNPWLAGGTARVILNEVVSANPSLLGGYVEVAGDKAQVVIANPAGVTCSGCGFINASRATLTTGTPIVNGGNLEGYRVQGGAIRIDGAGLDASLVGYTDLIARSVEINAGLWAQTLKVTTGANQVSADQSRATPVAGSGATPAFAIDVAQLGGMYAGKITLIGTEAGVGVRNAGTIGVSAGEVVVTADGQLTNRGTVISGDNPLIVSARGIDNSGTLSSERNLAVSSQGDIANTGLLHAGSELDLDVGGHLINHQGTLDGQRLEIRADRLTNENGTLRQNGTQALTLTAGNIANGTDALIGNITPSAGGSGGGTSTTTDPVAATPPPTTAGDGDSGITVISSSTPTALADGLIAVRGKLVNTTGAIVASGQVAVSTDGGLSNAGTLTLDQLTVAGDSFRNSGTIAATDAHLSTATVDNSSGTLDVAQTLRVTTGDFANVQGTLRHAGASALVLGLTGHLDNQGGQIASNGVTFGLTAADVNNTGGRIEHAGNGPLTVSTGRIDGENGRIESAGALILNASDAILDDASTIGDTVALSAATLSNQGGRIAQTGHGASSVLVAGRLDNRDGTIANTGSLNIKAGELDNRSGGQIVSNSDLTLTTTVGDLTNDGGTISGKERLSANVSGDLSNVDGQLVAGTDLTLTAGGSIDNAGGTLGAVTGTVGATLGGALNNTGGRLEAATALTVSSQAVTNVDGIVLGQTLAIDTHQQAFGNTGGTLIASGGTLTVQSGALTNTDGRIQAAGALTIDTHGQALVNSAMSASGGILGQSTVALTTDALNNSSGVIGAGDALTVSSNSLTNAGGRLSAQNRMTLTAGTLGNQGGDIQAGGDLTARATKLLDNTGGLMRTGGLLAVDTAHLVNADTKLANKGIEGTSVDIAAAVIDNHNGALRADKAVTIRNVGTLDNISGLISSEQTLAVTDESTPRTLVITNTAGTFIAGTDLAIRAKQLSGDGKVLSHGDLAVDLTANLANSGEITAAYDASVITAGVLTNSGTLQAGDILTVQAGTLDNAAAGKIMAGTLNLKATDTHTLTNRGLIDGGDTFLNAITLNNLGTGRIYGDHVAIAATTLNNLAEGGTAPVIAARDRLDIGAGTINNRDSALIFSAGDMSIGGALDTAHQATGRAGAITNASATVEAIGDLAIDSTSLVNQKTTFATTRVLDTTPPSGTALLDYAPDLEFHWPISESSATVWRDYIRDRYLNVIAKLLGGGPDAALVEVYNIEQTLPDTPSPVTRRDAFVNVWGNLKGYTGPEGGGLSSTYRSRLIAAVNARSAVSLDDSHEIWQIIVDTIATEHPEYIDQMAKTLAAQGTLQRTYRQVCADPTDDCSYVNNSISTHTTYRDQVSADSPAAVIRAGRDAAIDATALENRYSVIQSGRDLTLTGSTLTNIGAEFYQQTDTTTTTRRWHWVSRDHGSTTSASSTQTLIGSAPAIISAGGTLTGSYTDRIDNITIRQNAAPVVGGKGTKPDTTGTGSVGTSAAGAGTASTASTFGAAPGTITQVTAAGSASGPAAVIATTSLALTLPANRLLHVNPDLTGHPLVESDPAFANYRAWLSSDYMLQAMSLDPATSQKRLGDGFYEQRLITEQVAQLTGRRFLDGYTDDEAQYRALMNAGATVAREWQLVPGIALSEAQIAQLTSDIVWLVEREVTLADGTVQKVLVPQLYARVREGDLTPAGALLAAEDIDLETAGDLTTSGTIAGRQIVALSGENIAVLRGRIAGRDLAVQAENDLAVLGGSVEAERTLIATAGRDLTVASTTVDRSYRPSEGTAVNAAVQKTVIDRVAGLYVTGDSATGTGGTLVAAAGRDFTLLAAALANTVPASTTSITEAAGGDASATATATATAGSTLLTAGRDLTLGTITESNDASTRSKGNRWRESSTTEVGSTLVTDGDLALSAGHDLTAKAATAAAGGALTAAAGNDLTLTTGQATLDSETWHKSKKSGLLSKRSSERLDTLQTTTALSTTFSGDTVALTAGNDLTVKGSTVTAAHDLALSAGRDLILDTAQDTSRETHFRKEKSSGFSMSSMGAISYGKSSLQQNADGQAVTQVASTLSGENVAVTSGRDTKIVAGNVLADRDVTVLAGRNVDILAAANTEATQNRSKSSSTSFGLTPSVSGRFTAFNKASASEDGTATAITQSTAILAANGGDLTVRAGLDSQYKDTGQGNLVTQGADLLAGDALTLSGNAVDLQAVANTTSSHSVAKSKSLTVGAALAGPLGDKITAIGDAIERAQNSDNDRLQGALVLKAGYDAYKLSQGQTPPTTVPTGTETSPGAGSASSGIGVSVTLGTSKSKSESSTHATQVTGTNLQARTIDITASETDLAMAAAKLQAEDISLTAKRDILLAAAANTSEIHSSNKSSNASVGVTFAVGGQQNGFSIQISAAQAKGKANGTETSWDNTLITASDTLTVKSGRDTTLQGAQLAGKSVNLDVGRDLWVETLQDVSNYASKQTSSGFSLSLCIPPICGGTMVTGSISASNQKIKHAYQSAVGQSGIAAGEGGFDIRVGNHTELIGAAITSTAEADQNRFTTASLASRDLTNTQETKASSSSVGFSYGGGSALSTVIGNATQNVLSNLSGNAALPENGSESSTTQSVISPANITITGTGNNETDAQSQATADELTRRDPATANQSLTNTLTLQQAQVLEQKIQEQKEDQEAANLVGAVLSNVVGDVAKKYDWPEGSPQKIALHGLVGLIEAKIGDGSAAAGALGAISQEVMAPVLAQYLKDNGFDPNQTTDADGKPFTLEEMKQRKTEYDSLMQLAATLVGTAVGTLSTGDVKGGSTGANAAFVGVTNNFLKHEEVEKRDAAIRRLGTCGADESCRQDAIAEINKWNLEDTRRDNEMKQACMAPSSPECLGWYAQLLVAKTTYDGKPLGTTLKNELNEILMLDDLIGVRVASPTTFNTVAGGAKALLEPLAAIESAGKGLGTLAGMVQEAIDGNAQATEDLEHLGNTLFDSASSLALNSILKGGLVNALGSELAEGYKTRWDSAQTLEDAGLTDQAQQLRAQIVGEVVIIAASATTAIVKSGGAGASVELPGANGGGTVLADTQAALTQQVADLRATLIGSAKTSGNMGVAQIDIPGIQSTMAASSRVVAPSAEQRALGFVGEVPETFPSTVVPTGGNQPYLLNRAADSEAKILNNIAAQLGDNTSASGTINLLTERAPCASCSNIIQQFQVKYPNIKINVMDNGGVIRPTKKGP